MNEKKGEVILIVDDDPYTLESISSLLNEHGYSVVACGNAADAMAKLQENRIDIVLTDIRMPVVSGIELLEKIHSFNSEIPVILMTAYAELDIAIDAIRRGAFDFITKPYKHDYLIYIIEKAIKYKRLLKIEKDYKYTLEDTVRKRTQELTDALIIHKKAEEELKLRAQLLDAATDSIFVHDFEGNFIYVNEAAYKSRGYSKDELMGMNLYALDTLEYAKLTEQRVKKLPEKGANTFESVHLCKDRSMMSVEVHARIIKLGGRKLVISIARDITDRINLEEQVLYQKRLAGIGELASGIAHEIRNPLSNIKAAAQLCLKKYEPDEKIRKHLKIILNSSEKVNKVTRDLLNLAKPRDISFKIGSADKVINSAYNLVNARCLKQHVRLTKRLQRGLPQFFLDEKLLEEAFLNFILNAMDAMPKGGRLTITAYYDHDAEEILISFVDSGCGILEDNLSRIFDPFFTTKREGTGLGLSLALQVIELHKGKIHIKSKPDYGTEVTVRLPVYKERVSEDGPR